MARSTSGKHYLKMAAIAAGIVVAFEFAKKRGLVKL